MLRRKGQLRYIGTYQQLQAIVSMTGFRGVWELMPTGYWRFRCDCGAILNYWPSTGTINLQGSPEKAAVFRHAMMRVLEGGDSAGKKLLEYRDSANAGGQC